MSAHELQQWAREQEALLGRLVNVDSGSTDVSGVERVSEIMAGELSAMGFDVQLLRGTRYAPTLYATRGPQDRSVMLMGHMDTVFPAGTAARRPFAADEVSQTARGAGVVDMKAGLALLIYALRAACASDSRGSAVGLRVFLNADEEPGSPESRAHLPAVLSGVECVFLLEPPDAEGKLVLARRGVGVFHIQAVGKAGHAAEGVGANAAHALVRALEAVIGLQNAERGTSVNVGLLSGGVGPSIVPDAAEAIVDIRVASVAEQERIECALARVAEAEYPSGTGVSAQGRFHRPPMEPVPGTDRLQDLIVSVAKELGSVVAFEPQPRGGASDGNLVTSLGVRCIDGMGPVGGGSHTDGEWVDLASLRARTQLLSGVLARLLGVGWSPVRQSEEQGHAGL